MEVIQRILGKIVGHQVSAEEMEIVAGGLIDRCAAVGYSTYEDNETGGPIHGSHNGGTFIGCDAS